MAEGRGGGGGCDSVSFRSCFDVVDSDGMNG